MPAVVSCKRCMFRFWTDTNRTVCNRCKAHDAERQDKIKRARRYIEGVVNRNIFDVNWMVIQCIWRFNLTRKETQDLLGLSEEELSFEIDIARQNAR